MGVLTKPDLCSAGSEEGWLDFPRGKRKPILQNGWYVLKRPDAPGLLSGISREAAQGQEEVYFSTTPPWNAAGLAYRSNYGSQNIVRSGFCQTLKRLDKVTGASA